MVLTILKTIEPYRDYEGKLGFAIPFGDGNVEKGDFSYWRDYYGTWKDSPVPKLLENLACEMYWETAEVPLAGEPDIETTWNDTEIATDIIRECSESIIFIDDKQYKLDAYWKICTWFKEELDFAPRMVYYGPTRSGKSEALLSSTACLSHRGHDYTNPNIAPLYRDIETYFPTICIDSWQRIKDERVRDLEWLWEKGFTKGGTVARCTDKGKVERFKVYSWFAIATQRLPKAEDLLNRSVSIGMHEAKPVKRKMDLEVVRDLQARLLGMRLSVLSGRFRYDDMTFDELKTKAREVAMNWRPELDSRAIDIAESLLVPAMIFGDEDAVLQLISESQSKAILALRQTDEAGVHFALQALVNEQKRTVTLEGRGVVDPKRITTRDVAEQYNRDLESQGNEKKDRVHTKTVTRILDSLDYKFLTGRKANTTCFDPKTFSDVYRRHLVKFGPRSEDSN